MSQPQPPPQDTPNVHFGKRSKWVPRVLILIGVLAAACTETWRYMLIYNSQTDRLACYVATSLVVLYWLAIMGWDTWVRAGDREAIWKLSPKSMNQSFKTYAMVPASFCVLAFVTWPVLVLIFWMFELEYIFPITPDHLLPRLATILVAALVAFVLGRWAVKRLHIRFLANLRDRQICYQCSYDLRGNPLATCPECGFDNQSLYESVQTPDAQSPRASIADKY